ncbi:hypothetical protein LTR56_027289 [Elasticomyces elasticus]|nr:hypothetical protein LTR56_027289 [Elasticomyces elasticus]KAK5733554.1 hypothetical protein LTS12_026910 [Elasticomyces elasticus]
MPWSILLTAVRETIRADALRALSSTFPGVYPYPPDENQCEAVDRTQWGLLGSETSGSAYTISCVPEDWNSEDRMVTCQTDADDTETLTDEQFVVETFWVPRNILEVRTGERGSDWKVDFDSCTIDTQWFERTEVNGQLLSSYASGFMDLAHGTTYVKWRPQWVRSSELPAALHVPQNKEGIEAAAQASTETEDTLMTGIEQPPSNDSPKHIFSR